MIDETHTHDDACTCSVDVTPSAIRAGVELSLQARVTCTPPRDLRGQVVHVVDHDGRVVATAAIEAFDGFGNTSGIAKAQAPVASGTYTWHAVVANGTEPLPASIAGVQGTAFALAVTPHPTQVTAWGAPAAVTPGERFSVKVGVRCTDDILLTGAVVHVHDHHGCVIASGEAGREPWPGTTALVVAEIGLEAPAERGNHVWEARTPASDLGVPHTAGSARFGVKVVAAPEYRVRVTTHDRATHAPIPQLHVLMHPFRVFTDEDGIAELLVPGGTYRLHVSGRRYVPFRQTLEVGRDVTVGAELELEPDDSLPGIS